MRWVVKSHLGRFGKQPQGFKTHFSIENQFFVCDCPVRPDSDFVVEFPEKFHGIGAQYIYLFNNGKRAFIYLGEEYEIALSQDGDHKGRKAMQYTPAQLEFRLELIKWIALNVFLPDKQRMLNIDQAEVERFINEVQAINDDRLLKDYVKDNLYYNC
jgi:hypothetical protein